MKSSFRSTYSKRCDDYKRISNKILEMKKWFIKKDRPVTFLTFHYKLNCKNSGFPKCQMTLAYLHSVRNGSQKRYAEMEKEKKESAAFTAPILIALVKIVFKIVISKDIHTSDKTWILKKTTFPDILNYQTQNAAAVKQTLMLLTRLYHFKKSYRR